MGEKGVRKASDTMSTDLFTVTSDDIMNLATKIMDWKKERHSPGVRYRKLVGIVTEHDFANISGGLFEGLFVQNQSIANAKNKSK